LRTAFAGPGFRTSLATASELSGSLGAGDSDAGGEAFGILVLAGFELVAIR